MAPLMTHGREKVQCPWCGRLVGWSKKGNLEHHINQAGNACCGSGHPRDSVMQIKRAQLAEAARKARGS
jgi:uncharacterized C2H2 Zn-finger protein